MGLEADYKKDVYLGHWNELPLLWRKAVSDTEIKKESRYIKFFCSLAVIVKYFFDIPAAILLSSFPVLFFLIMSLNPFLMLLSNKEEDVIPFEK